MAIKELSMFGAIRRVGKRIKSALGSGGIRGAIKKVGKKLFG